MPYASELPQVKPVSTPLQPHRLQHQPQPANESVPLRPTASPAVLSTPSGADRLQERPSLPVLISLCQRVVSQFVSEAAQRCYQNALAPKLEILSALPEVAASLQLLTAGGDGRAGTGESRLAALQQVLAHACRAGLPDGELRQTVADLQAVMDAVNSLRSEQSLARLSTTLLTLESLCSASGPLAWTIGAPALLQLGQQLGLVRYWAEWLCRVSSLPVATPQALFSSLYSQNLLPEWLQHALEQLESVFSLAGDEAQGSAKTRLKQITQRLNEAASGVEKMGVLLEMLQDTALQAELIPSLNRVSPDLAAALQAAQLLTAEWHAVPAAGRLEELLGICTRLGADDFQARFRRAMAGSRVGTLLVPVVEKTGGWCQRDSSLMAALALGTRLSDPKRSWPDKVALLLAETNLPEVSAGIVRSWVTGKVLSWFALLPDTWQNLAAALVNTSFWQQFSVTPWQDVPQLIRDTVCTDTRLQEALADVILGEEGRWIWSLVQLLVKHNQQAPAAVRRSWRLTLAQLIASGRLLANPPDALLTLAECMLSLSVLYDCWHASEPQELAYTRLLSDEMVTHLQNGPLQLSGKLLPWMPLLRQLSGLSGYVLPQAEAGDSLVSWLAKVASALREQGFDPDELLYPSLQPLLQPLMLPDWMTEALPAVLETVTLCADECSLLNAMQAGFSGLLQRAGDGLLRGLDALVPQLSIPPLQMFGGLTQLVFLLVLPFDATAEGGADTPPIVTERQQALDELALLEERIGYLQIALGLSLTALLAPPLILLLKNGVAAYRGGNAAAAPGNHDLEMQALTPESGRDPQTAVCPTETQHPLLVGAEASGQQQEAPSLLTRFRQQLSSQKALYAIEAVALGATLTSGVALTVYQQRLEEQRWDWMPLDDLSEPDRIQLIAFFTEQDERLANAFGGEENNLRVKRGVRNPLAVIPLPPESAELPDAVILEDKTAGPAAPRIRLEKKLSDIHWSYYPKSLRDKITNEMHRLFLYVDEMDQQQALSKLRPILSIMLRENYKTYPWTCIYIIELMNEISNIVPDMWGENEEIASLWRGEVGNKNFSAIFIYQDVLQNDLVDYDAYVWAREAMLNPDRAMGVPQNRWVESIACYEFGIQKVNKELREETMYADSNEKIIRVMKHLYFDIVREEINLITRKTIGHEKSDTIKRERVQAAKAYLNESIVLQQSLSDWYPIMQNLPKTEFHADYRDVYHASHLAQNLMFNKSGDEVLTQHLLVSALIYHILKRRHEKQPEYYPLAQDIISQFVIARDKFHPFGSEWHIPDGFYPLVSLAPQGKDEGQRHYMDRFNKYINNYAAVEAEAFTRRLVGDLLCESEDQECADVSSSSLTLEELINPIKKYYKYYQGDDSKVNKVMVFQLYNDNWLLLVIENGKITIDKYTKDNITSENTMDVLTTPEDSFGYCRVKGVDVSYEPYDRYFSYYPYESESNYSDNNDDIPMGESKLSEWTQFWVLGRNKPEGYTYKLRIPQGDIKGKINPKESLFKLLLENITYHYYDIATQRKDDLQRASSTAHTLANIFIPYYQVMYKVATDGNYKLTAEDGIMLFMDTGMIFSAGIGAGMKIGNKMIQQVTKIGLDSVNSGLTRRAVMLEMARKLGKLARNPEIAKTVLKAVMQFSVDIIEPIPLRQLVKTIYHNVRPSRYITAGRYMGQVARALLHEDSYDRALPALTTNMSPEDRARLVPSSTSKGIYELPAARGVHTKELYIQQDGELYKVEWDDYSKTMRLASDERDATFQYNVAVKKVGGRWETYIDTPRRHADVRFRNHTNPNAPDETDAEDVRFMYEGEGASSNAGGSSGAGARVSGLSQFPADPKPMKKLLPIELQEKTTVKKIDEQNLEDFKDKHNGHAPMQLKGFSYPPSIGDEYNFGQVESYLKKSWENIEEINNLTSGKILNSLSKDDEVSVYLSKCLGVNDVGIIEQVKERIVEITRHLSGFLTMTKDNDYKNIIIQASKRAKDPMTNKYLDNVNPDASAATAWIYPSDPERRIFIDADVFSPSLVGVRPPAAKDIVSFTLLHESTHIVVLTEDILYYDEKIIIGQSAKEMMERMDEKIKNKGLSKDGVDRFIEKLKSVLNYSAGFDYDDFYNKIQSDKVFKVSVIMNNADSVAKILMDIARGRNFDGKIVGETLDKSAAGPSRQVREAPENSPGPLTHGLLALIIKSRV